MIKKLSFLLVISMILGGIIYFALPHKTIIESHNLVIEKSLQELVNDSDVIIKGKVVNKLPSRWSNQNFWRGDEISNILQTDFQIMVYEIFYGNPYNYNMISVRVDRGTTEEVEFISNDVPDFVIGQEVILFLSIDDSDVAFPNENYYVLTGMGQGLYIREPLANSLYTCFYDDENQNIIEEELFREMINTLKK